MDEEIFVFILESEDDDYPNDHCTHSVHKTLDGAKAAVAPGEYGLEEEEWYETDDNERWVTSRAYNTTCIIRRVKLLD